MLHKTDIPFCLWICTRDAVHIELPYFLFLTFPSLDVCLQRHCIFFLFPVVCSFCVFNHHNFKVWIITVEPYTFWHIIPFHTFLHMIYHFFVRDTCISTECHDVHHSVSHCICFMTWYLGSLMVACVIWTWNILSPNSMMAWIFACIC
jgi:hypothetical protein